MASHDGGSATEDPQRAEASGGLGARAKIGLTLAIVVAASLVVTGSLPGMNPVTAGGEVPLLGALFPIGLGLTAMYFGWRECRRYQLSRNTPTSTVRSLAVGAAEVEGRAVPVDEPLTSPLTGTDAVLHEIEIQQVDPGHDDQNDTILEASDHVAFAVDDGTGAVRVDPAEAEVLVETEKRTRIPADEDPPAPLAAWAQDGFREGTRHQAAGAEASLEEAFPARTIYLDEDLATYLSKPADRERVVEERVIAVDEPVYVWGAAYRREDADHTRNERNLVMREHGGTGTLVISDGSEPELHEHRIDGALWMLGTAVVALVLGSVLLAGRLGWV